MEAQYKAAARSAQLLAIESVQGSGTLSTTTAIETQLHQVWGRFIKFLYLALGCIGHLPLTVVPNIFFIIIYLTFHSSYMFVIRVYMFVFSQLKEKSPSILKECQSLFPLLEELENQISAFYQTAELAGHIITQQHNQQMCQVRQTTGTKTLLHFEENSAVKEK